jgi:hypothetical protein
LQCSNPQSAGGSSDHGNSKIAGIIRDCYGDPAASVSIYLRPSNFNPVKDDKSLVKVTISNAEGCFLFDNLDTGSYCVSGEDTTSRSFLKRVILRDSQITLLDSLALNNPGSISIKGESIGLKSGHVAYLRGLSKYCVIDSTGNAKIENVPSGIVSLKGYSLDKKQEIPLNSAFDSLIILPNLTYISSVSPSPFFVQANKILPEKRSGFTDSLYMFSCVDPFQNITSGYSFRYTWGDGVTSEWTDDPRQINKWSKPGVFQIQSQVRYCGNYYAWSIPLTITITSK